MNQFESDLYHMVQYIEFKNAKSNFPMQLPNDVKNIKKNPKLLIPADKTNNLYEFTNEEYNKFLIKNIGKTYKKTYCICYKCYHAEAKTIAKDLKLDERIEQYNHITIFYYILSIFYYTKRSQRKFRE